MGELIIANDWLLLRMFRVALCAALITVAIFALSPQPLTTEMISQQDKWEHVAAFAVLQSLALLALPSSAVRAAIGLVMFAVLIELFQSFMPGRTASSIDLAASSVGVLLPLLLARVFLRK